LQETSLNSLFALGPAAMRDLRRTVADMLDQGSSGNQVRRHASDLLTPMVACTLHRHHERRHVGTARYG
jgi:fumarylacetoacetase